MQNVPIKKIISNFNHRERGNENEGIDVLMASIKKDGLLQPVGLIKDGDKYNLVFGNRRLEAFKKLGKTDIPAVILDKKSDDLIPLNLIENLARLDVSPFEVGYAINALITKQRLTPKEIAIRIGIGETAVREFHSVFKYIPSKYKDKIINTRGKGKRPAKYITLRSAYQISSLKKNGALTTEEGNKILDALYDKKVAVKEIGKAITAVKKGVDFKSLNKLDSKLKNLSVSVLIDKKIYDIAESIHSRPKLIAILEHKLKETVNQLSLS